MLRQRTKGSTADAAQAPRRRPNRRGKYKRSDPTSSDSLHIPLGSDSSCHASESYISAINAERPFNSSAMFTPYTAQDRTAVEAAQKNTLAIVLTEPVVFLRPRSVQVHASGAADPGPSSMLRGLLSLTLRNPTRITSISVELTCTTRSAITEGVPLSAKCVFRLAKFLYRTRRAQDRYRSRGTHRLQCRRNILRSFLLSRRASPVAFRWARAARSGPDSFVSNRFRAGQPRPAKVQH
jgi:hypothetical protein